MKEDIKLRKVMNKINDINKNNEEENDLLIKEKDDIEDLFIEGKSTNIKIKLAKQFIFLDEHHIFTAFLKLFFGIITILLPLIFIFAFTITEYSEKNNYIFFPCFLSLSIILATLLILLVIKISEGCQISGLILYSWERKNIINIANSLLYGIFILWILFVSEKFIKWFNLLKEKVAQTNESSSQKFNKGSYTERILFILYFWDLEKDKYGEYLHKKLEYFEYEDSVFSEFHEYIKKLFIPVIIYGFYNLFKLILFKYHKPILSFILSFVLNLLIIIISFFITFSSINNDTNNKSDKIDDKVSYFSNINCKYYELVTYILIIIILIIKSFMSHFKLIKKKYYSRKKNDNNKIIKIISAVAFLINLTSYIILICDIIFLTFDKIDQNFTIDRYENYWNLLYIGGFLIFFGYTYIFGHHFFDLIFYPIAYEISPHELKNKFYVNCSGTLIETKQNIFTEFKFSKSQKQVNPFNL